MNEKTTHHSLKLLGKSILGKLENRKFIEVVPANRNALLDAFVQHLSRTVMTDENFTDRVRKEISNHADAIADQNITETSAFQSRKRALKEQMGEHQLHGFYFQVPLREIVIRASKFFLDSTLVDEVFESDEALHKLMIEIIQNFDENKVS